MKADSCGSSPPVGWQNRLRRPVLPTLLLALALLFGLAWGGAAALAETAGTAGHMPGQELYPVDDTPDGVIVSPGVGFVAAPRAISAAEDDTYLTTVFTFSDIAVFSYFDETEIRVENTNGVEVFSGVLAKNSYQRVRVSSGVYRIYGSKSYTVLVGDALTSSVQGFFALDESGQGKSTLLNTYMPRYAFNGERFIVFAYEDGTEFTIKNLDTGVVLNAGLLNDGQRFVMPTTPNGTFLQVSANKPVSALSYADQDYYVPSVTGSFAGTKFYGYSAFIGAWTNSITVTAYSDDTAVTVRDTDTGDIIVEYTLNEGQVHSHPIRTATFWTVESDKPVTAANIPFAGWTGSYWYLARAIDASGTGAGNLFYVPTIGSRLDVFSLDADNDVVIERLGLHDQYPYTSPSQVWSGTLQAGEGTNLTTTTGRYVYKVTGTGRVSVIQSNGGAGADFMTPGYFDELPDLMISAGDIAFDREEYEVGDTVTTTLTVHNIGPVAVQDVLVRAHFGDPDVGVAPLIAERTIAALDGQASTTTSFDFVVPTAPEYRNIVVMLDPLGAIEESNKSNNKATKPLRPNEDLRPPLAVTVTAPAALAVDGEGELDPNPFQVKVTIFNNGEVDAVNVVVTMVPEDGLTIENDPVVSSSEQDSHTFASIAPNASTTATWSLRANPDQSGINRYRVEVVADNDDPKQVKRSVLVPDTTPPAAPTGLDGDWNEEDGIDLTWTENSESDLAGYQIFYGTSADVCADPQNDPIVLSTFTAYTLNELDNDNDYFFALKAFDTSDNFSECSEELKVPATAEYVVTVAANPEDAGIVEGGGEYSAGDEATVIATANDGFVFVSWTEGQEVVATTAEYAFSVMANRDLTANFIEETEEPFTVTVAANPEDGGVVAGGDEYPAGDVATVTAEANEGFVFVSWTEGEEVVATTPEYAFAVTVDRDLVANFESAQLFNISVSASPQYAGQTSGGGEYAAGDSATVEAVTNTGYAFVNWTEDGEVVSRDAGYTFEVTGDRDLVANFIFTAVSLNDTGIQFCGAGLSGNQPCRDSDPQGQDAHHGRDNAAAIGALSKVGAGHAGFDFTKIANNGSVLPASAQLGSGPNDWACTRDNVTGLIWEVKVNNPSHVRHVNHTYTWYNPDSPDGNSGSMGGTTSCTWGTSDLEDLPACNTENYVAAVNEQGLCGITDWRLPAISDLETISNLGRSNPAIDMFYFPNTAVSSYWSETPNAFNSSNAWYVYAGTGASSDTSRAMRYRVRLASGGQAPAERNVSAAFCQNNLNPTNPDEFYKVHEDGTVTDTRTGLMWKVCAEGQTWDNGSCSGDGAVHTWANALNHAQRHEFAGYDDWRLPNIKELRGLVEECRAMPSINTTVFPNMPSALFWSASPSEPLTNASWYVYFVKGLSDYQVRSNQPNVRLVRDAPPELPASLTVIIEPEAVQGAAQWRRTDTEDWLASHATEMPVEPGEYVVVFSDVDGWVAPENLNVTVNQGQNVTLTAEYTVAPATYALTVEQGTGSGRYEEGDEVAVSAAQLPDKRFDAWTVEPAELADILADSSSADTTVTMPAQDVTVRATYETLYALEVVEGSGSGSYAAGETIQISANTPDPDMELEFAAWIVDPEEYVVNLVNSASPDTEVTMPEADLTVVATYREQAPTYTVTYYKNGEAVENSAPVDPRAYEADTWVFILGNSGNMFLEEHVFKGWTDDPDSDVPTVTHIPGETFQITEDVDLYAVWENINLRRLYLPHVNGTDDDWFTQIALVNAGHDPADVTLRVMNNSGEQVAVCQVPLPAGSRVEYVAGQDDCLPAIQGYVEVETFSDGLTGFTRFGKTGEYRMSLPLQEVYAEAETYVPYVESNEDQETIFGLVNPGDDAKTVEIELLANDGKPSVKEVELAAGERKLFTVLELLLAIYDEEEAAEERELIKTARISNLEGMVGYTMLRHDRSVQLDGIPFTPMGTSLLIPHVYSFAEDEWTTILVFANPSQEESAELTLSGYSIQSGKVDDYTVPLEPGQREVVFPWQEPFSFSDDVAWLSGTSDNPVAGMVIYIVTPEGAEAPEARRAMATATAEQYLRRIASETDPANWAMIPIMNITGQSGVFPVLDPYGKMDTTIVNTESEPAFMTLEAVGEDGTILIRTDRYIRGFNKLWLESAQDLMRKDDEDVDMAGVRYIRYAATRAMSGLQINGSFDPIRESTMVDSLVAQIYPLQDEYPLTLERGERSGMFPFGRRVSISADLPDRWQIFKEWQGDPWSLDRVDNIYNPNTMITMPAGPITLEAVYERKGSTRYNLQVENGQTSGDHTAGKFIPVSADDLSPLFFDRWIGTGAPYLTRVNVPSPQVIMPRQDIVIEATFTDTLPTPRELTLLRGRPSGTNRYLFGRVVRIFANLPPTLDMMFDKWIGNADVVANANLPDTRLTMPNEDIEIEATFKLIPEGDFTVTVQTAMPALSSRVSTAAMQRLASYRTTSKPRPGEWVTLIAPEALEGLVFDVWTGQTSYIEDVTSPKTRMYMPDHNVTVVATYKESDSTQRYGVLYDANHGSNPPQDTGRYLERAEVVVKAPGAMSREDHRFMAWNTSPDRVTARDDADEYLANETFLMPQGGITLYAQWISLEARAELVTHETRGCFRSGCHTPEQFETFNLTREQWEAAIDRMIREKGFILDDPAERSAAADYLAETYPPAVEPIPTLSEWGMIILSMVMLLLGVGYLRRQRFGPRPAL